MEVSKEISGEKFSAPYRAGTEVITDPVIMAVAPPFHLIHADYAYLTNSHSTWSEWAIRFVIAGGVAAAPVLWRQIIASTRGSQQPFDLADYGPSGLLLGVAFVLWLIGKLCPTQRDRVLKAMKNHFDSAQTKIEVRR